MSENSDTVYLTGFEAHEGLFVPAKEIPVLKNGVKVGAVSEVIYRDYGIDVVIEIDSKKFRSAILKTMENNNAI